MEEKIWRKDEKLRQLKEIVQVGLFGVCWFWFDFNMLAVVLSNQRNQQHVKSLHHPFRTLDRFVCLSVCLSVRLTH